MTHPVTAAEENSVVSVVTVPSPTPALPDVLQRIHNSTTLNWYAFEQMQADEFENAIQQLIEDYRVLFQIELPHSPNDWSNEKELSHLLSALDNHLNNEKLAISCLEMLANSLSEGLRRLEAESHLNLQNQLQSLEKKINAYPYYSASAYQSLAESNAELDRLRSKINACQKVQRMLVTRLEILAQAAHVHINYFERYHEDQIARLTSQPFSQNQHHPNPKLSQTIAERLRLQRMILLNDKRLNVLVKSKCDLLQSETKILKKLYEANFSTQYARLDSISQTNLSNEPGIKYAESSEIQDALQDERLLSAMENLPFYFPKILEEGKKLKIQEGKADSMEKSIQKWAYAARRALMDYSQASINRQNCTDDLVRCQNNLAAIKDHYYFWVQDMIPSLSVSFMRQLLKDLSDCIRYVSTHLFSGKVWTVPCALLAIIAVGIRLAPFLNPGTTQRYQRFQHTLQVSLGRVNKDRFIFSLQAMLWELLFSLPNALGLLIFGCYLSWFHAGYNEQHAIGYALLQCSILAFSLDFLHRLASPNGIFLTHFRWDAEKITRIFRFYPLLFLLSLLSLGFTVLFSYPNTALYYPQTLGRLSFILLCLTSAAAKLISWSNGAVLTLSSGRTRTVNTMNHIIWIIFCLADMIFASFALRGYFGASKTVMFRFEIAFAVWLLTLFAYYLAFRFLLILRRSKAFDMAKARRNEILALRARQGEDSAGLPSEVEEPIIDLENLSRRTLELLRFLLVIIGGAGIWIVSKPVRPALITALVQIRIIGNLTVASLAALAIVGFFCSQGYRNLPALIEMCILPFLDINKEAEFTLKQVTRYVILFFCLVTVAWIANINLREQWWLTILSGAVGFGLRDPALSLLSGGLILLFKWIRIGDTVTIGGITGVVTQIESFTSIILDSEKRENVVPNKDFMITAFARWTTDIQQTTLKLEVIPSQKEDGNTVSFFNKLQSILDQLKNLNEIKPASIGLKSVSQTLHEYEVQFYLTDQEQIRLAQGQIFESFFTELSKHGATIKSLSLVKTG